jgi:hypothetical protein
MPKAPALSPDERRLQKGHVVVTKFLAYLRSTNTRGVLVLESEENGTPALLTITSGDSWLADVKALADRQPRIVANLRAKDCVVVDRRDFRRQKRLVASKTPWFAKLPIEGLFERVCSSIEGRETPASEQALRDSVTAYFGTEVAESMAIEKLKDYFEFEPVPQDVYLDFPSTS